MTDGLTSEELARMRRVTEPSQWAEPEPDVVSAEQSATPDLHI